MDTYSKKFKWKMMLFLAAILIGIVSLWYTNRLVKQLSIEERKKVELWAEGSKLLATSDDLGSNIYIISKIIHNNETVPVIWVKDSTRIINWRNIELPDNKDEYAARQQFDSLSKHNKKYLARRLEKMGQQNPPIEVEWIKGQKDMIFYGDSSLQVKLYYFPIIQLLVVFLFVGLAYLGFSTARKAEQNQVWVGLSKETAHQLGTPISSLLAWVEILRSDERNARLVSEVEKDVSRLEKITERFSKIGSTPSIEYANIVEILYNAVNYVKKRVSSRVEFVFEFSPDEAVPVPINESLFEWVIENLCKNAVDAMDGIGKITVSISDHVQVLYVDIHDTGKGIVKSKYKTIFQPGYTTKKRGWGLGLSLSKRIIEEYHKGKIFVKSSEVEKGTTIRIALKK